MAGILKGLASRRPAIFNIYAPCQTEHGIPDDASEQSAKLALESRAVPYMVYDPDAGTSMSERLDLDGNPELDQDWPTYELKYKDENGKDQVMELPMTIADWAATEVRFAKHFQKVRGVQAAELVPYHEYLKLSKEEAEGKAAFIYVLAPNSQLNKFLVSEELVALGRERLDFWNELREISGDLISEEVREKVSEEKEAEFEAKIDAIKAEYEAKIENLKQSYPQEVARRMAEALMGQGSNLDSFVSSVAAGPSAPVVSSPSVKTAPAPAPATQAPAAEAAPSEEEEPGLAPWIEEDTCTACGDCLKVNPKMFVYGDSGKAIITDPKNGTFKDLVVAAERCPSGSIHPGEPVNKKEKNLDKLVARAEPFN
jgi:pyruvate-ferredoxin/flavodoxin oxidoreductase